MATSVEILKTYFETGDHPTEAQFVEMLEAFVHRDDDLTQVLGQMAEINEAEQGLVTDKYMSPFLVFQAIKALTRVANIPELIPEIEAIIEQHTNQLVLLSDFNVRTSIGIVVQTDLNSVFGLKTPSFSIAPGGAQKFVMMHGLGHTNYDVSINTRHVAGVSPTFPVNWSPFPDPSATVQGSLAKFADRIEVLVDSYGTVAHWHQFQIAITNHNLL